MRGSHAEFRAITHHCCPRYKGQHLPCSSRILSLNLLSENFLSSTYTSKSEAIMTSARYISNFLLINDDDQTGHGDDTQNSSSLTRTSQLSTNYTTSNNVGVGRVLGNFYSFCGRRLERTVNTAAHKTGHGPTATYEKIHELACTDWLVDAKTSTILETFD